MRTLFKLPFGKEKKISEFLKMWNYLHLHLHSVFQKVKLIIKLTMLGSGSPYFPDPLWENKKYTTLWMEIHWKVDDVTKSTMTTLNFNFSSK